MKYVFCLDSSCYTGSLIYMLNYIEYMNFDDIVCCSQFVNINDPLAIKYNIIPYKKELINKDVILIVNDLYCCKVLEELDCKPQKTILWYHNGYLNIQSLYNELIKRNSTISTDIIEFKKNINKVDEIVIVNKGQKNIFSFYEKKITLLHSSIKQLKKISVKKNNQKKEKKSLLNPIRLLCVGTLCPRKGQLELLKIFNSMKFNRKVELYLIGLELNHPHKYYVDYGQECLKYANSNIKIIESCDSKKYYDLCDIFILFSESEQCPLVILEALNNGLPVITRNCGNVNLMIDNNGFIFNNFVDAEMYMYKMINDDELRNSMTENTRKSIHKFYTKHVSKCDMFKKIIGTPIIIYVDFDNTIVNYEKQFLIKWNSLYNDNKTDMKFIINKTVVNNFHDNFYKDVIPYENAIKSLNELNRLPNCIVKICTISENNNVTLQKKKWIEKYLDITWVDRLISIEHGDKSHIICDIMIDDNPNIIIDNKTNIIYYSQNYNKHMQDTSWIPYFTWNNYNTLLSQINSYK
jgi:glycosyltransferase involved in cell wall biosynthesis